METQLAHFDKAKQELALAQSVDEVKNIRDKAEAMRAYAKQSGESLEMQNMCAEIKLRAERRGGELLKEDEEISRGGDTRPEAKSHRATLDDYNINKSQSSRWQQIADLPEEKFEEHISKTKEAQKELTSSSVLRVARDVKEASAKADVAEIPVPIGKYKVVVVDPPWPVQKITREERPNQQEFDYPVMSIDEIMALDVPTADDCHLFLWTTQKFLPEAWNVVLYWGFRYVLTMVWHKAGGFQPFGLPQYNCEFVIYARKGSPQFIDTKEFACCFNGKRREHSRKPDEFYDMIKRVTDEPRIDYFSREQREGYDQYGNEPGRFQSGHGTRTTVC